MTVKPPPFCPTPHLHYLVIHICLTPSSGAQDLPHILSTPPRNPPSSSSNLGSRNYASRPFAVAVGGGFDDAAFAEIRGACKDVEKGVAWVRADTSKWSSMPSLSDHEGFGAAMAARVKKTLMEMGVGRGEGEGKEAKRMDGVYLF
jgi:hypothetical protein